MFCNKLKWDLLAGCLDELALRLSYGSTKDLLPLVRLGPEVPTMRARVLFEHGIRSSEDVIDAGVDVIADILMQQLPFEANDDHEKKLKVLKVRY